MKRLYRSRKERMPGGICRGIGEHIDVDPTFIRLIRAVITLLSPGTGSIVSLIAWIVIPEVPDDPLLKTTTTA
jgi:phage shock protein C